MLKIGTPRYQNLKRLGAVLTLAVLIILAWHWPLKAQTQSQSFQTDQSLQKGMIVIIKEDDASKVEAASELTIKRIHGVATEAGQVPDPNSGEKQTVAVASSGSHNVLVSDEGGAINGGDYVTISTLPGVGMKATSDQGVVVGRALDKFDGQSGVIGRSQLVSDGNKEVTLGYVTVDVVIETNPLINQPTDNLPSLLKKIGANIAQKPVSIVRAYLALLVFIIATIVTTTMLYAGIKTSMTSIGRNPLVKPLIVHQLIRVVGTGVVIFITGLIGVYLILRL